MDTEISVWDNEVTAREYISYIAEQSGTFASIGRDGKLYFRKIGETNINVDKKFLKDMKYGENFKISYIAYEDGVQDFKQGTKDYNTVWINQENMYINNQEQIDTIYNYYKDFECYSFEGGLIIDPAIEVGDVIVIDGKPVIYQGELSYCGKFFANIKSEIKSKAKQETSTKVKSDKAKIRRIESKIDQAEGNIILLGKEVTEHEDKLSEIKLDIDSITHKVENVVGITREVSGITKIQLEDCMEGRLTELHIYGNNSISGGLYPSKKLYPSKTLYPSKIKYSNESIKIHVYSEDLNNDREIDLGINLKQYEGIYDEYVLEDNKAKVIRRIGEDNNGNRYILESERIEDLGELQIELAEGINYVEIINQIANMKAKYVILNDFTKHFSTNVEMYSIIQQYVDSILLEVGKKVGADELKTAIELAENRITLKVNEKISEDELNSTLDMLVDSIMLEVNKKIGEEDLESALKLYEDEISATVKQTVKEETENKIDKKDILASWNLAVKNGEGIVTIEGNKIIIKTDNFKLDENGNVIITGKKGNPYNYTMLDAYLALSHITEDICLPSNLLDVYRINSTSGNINVTDVVAILDIIKGKKKSTKTFNADVVIDPNQSEKIISLKLTEDLQTIIGLFQIYSYMIKCTNLLIGSGYDVTLDNAKYGIQLDGSNKRIKIIDTNQEVETTIDSGKVDAYNVYASSGGSKGYCIHSRGTAHTYMIDYASYYGTNYFLIYLDRSNYIPLVNSVYVDSQQIAQISHQTSYFEYVVPRYGAFGISGVFQSDTQLKENINDTKLNAIDIINKIRHIEFDWKDTKMAVGKGHEEIGYSANQIEEDIGMNIVYEVEQPESSEFEKIKQINENRIMPLVTKAIQELSEDNKKLREENEKQNKIIDFLINKLNCKEEFEEYMKGEK